MRDSQSKARPFYMALSGLAALFMSGCNGLAPNTTVQVPVLSGKATGRVMGGQQPVANVALQLYAVGSSGYGSAATPLLTPNSVMTTPSGNFTIPSFTCPVGNPLVYLVGTGGQPITGVTNGNLALMVGLGNCSTVGSAFIDMNEVTTVASVWALAPFMTGIANVGTSATNPTGLVNAFAAINEVANTTNGAVSGPSLPGNATLPATEINTLADILEQCVNSGGGSASDTTDGVTNGTGCGKLFYLTTIGSSSPTDTITAAMNMAQNPGQNVANLNKLRSNSPVFQPAMNVNSPPTDWTIAINYTGGGLNAPQSVAVDQSGNVWLANSGNSSVSKFSATGSAISGSGGFTAGSINVPYAIAIDQSGNAWIANSGNNTITKLSADGSTGTAFSNNGLSAPKSIAIDASGNIFVGNSSSAGISGFTSAGAPLTNSPFTGGGSTSTTAIAINPK